MPDLDPLTDPDLAMCPRRWPRAPGDPVPGGHRCAEFGPHNTHRCCCGEVESDV